LNHELFELIADMQHCRYSGRTGKTCDVLFCFDHVHFSIIVDILTGAYTKLVKLIESYFYWTTDYLLKPTAHLLKEIKIGVVTVKEYKEGDKIPEDYDV